MGLGYALSQKGYKVKYDLSWFREYGKDVDGIFARNYDMQRAFPNLEFEEATDKEIKLYSKNTEDVQTILRNFLPQYILMDILSAIRIY